MIASEDRESGIRVFLTVGCGMALQLSLVHLAMMLVHSGAAFPVFAAHVAGWGCGLGLATLRSPRFADPAVLAAAAAAVAWLGTELSAAHGFWLGIDAGISGMVVVALASALLTGLSIGLCLAACRKPLLALAADLLGVGIAGASHVALTAALPLLSPPLIWLVLLAINTKRLGTAVATAIFALALLIPLVRPAVLARAETPLGRALRADGLQAWLGSYHDLDGRVDAVAEGTGSGVRLYINGGTQAQTPRAVHDRVTTAIVEALQPSTALVLGAGGMADVDSLLASGVERITAVERSPAVLRAARQVAPAARRIFTDGRVRVVEAEARRFVASAVERFDLVLLPLAYASAGVSPAALTLLPTSLFTTEGIEALGEVASQAGAVCFVFPSTLLRDRLLSTLGSVEERRGTRHTLAARLWVVHNPGTSAYSEMVCWAPNQPLPLSSLPSDLQVLHRPDRPASPTLIDRLGGVEAFPPVSDWRPYFFDLYTFRPGGAVMPPFLSGLFSWTGLSTAFVVVVIVRRRRNATGQNSPPASHLAVAWLTGFAFPALEYVVLSIARAAGYSEGAAYAAAAISFALAGLAAIPNWGSLGARALLGSSALTGAAAFFAFGGVAWIFDLSAGHSLVFGSVFMLALMSAGVGPFAMLFRAAQSRSLDGGEARQFFLASALGTLAGVAPVLAIDLRWGVPGTALVAGLAYALVFGVAVISASERSRPNQS